jgi:hypothetical protein
MDGKTLGVFAGFPVHLQTDIRRGFSPSDVDVGARQ